MTASYEKVNYALRPAKNIERKMIAETIGRLTTISPLSEYRYIGFGSTFFSDFSVFHRRLGITKMISLEQDVAKQARFEFNRPFKCIEMKYGNSNDELPQLPWTDKTILWLDYDSQLDGSALSDASFFAANATPGSILLVTLDVRDEPLQKGPLKLLKDRVGDPGKMPAGLRDTDFTEWGTASVARRIVDNEIREAIAIRNGPLTTGRRLHYRQLFNFNYADGARMLTVGGLLYEERQRVAIRRCAFERLFFVREGPDPYLLRAPNLTLREIRHFDTKLPSANVLENETHSIPDDDLLSFSELYRYFPAFVDAEL